MQYTEKDYKELVKSIKIYPDYLDEDCIEQPNLYFHASNGFALAMAKRDDIKRRLELLGSQIDEEVRLRSSAEGEKKPTEPEIKHIIIRDKRYQDMSRDYIESCLVANEWKSLKASFENRKDMLEVMQRLYSSGYWGEVSGVGERSEAHSIEKKHRKK
jgi:hypothetical protein